MIEGVRAYDEEKNEVVIYGKIGLVSWGIYYDGRMALWFDGGDVE